MSERNSALAKLHRVYPEAALQIDRIVDLVFTPNEMWRNEVYADKFFAELFNRIDGIAAYARRELRDQGISEITTEDMKEASDHGRNIAEAES